MFNRYLITFSFFFSLLSHNAYAACVGKIEEALESQVAGSVEELAPYHCVNKYNNFEFTTEDTIGEFCDCTKKNPFKIKDYGPKDDEEKIKQVGDYLISEVIDLAEKIDDMSNEISVEELEGMGQAFPESCNLPKMFDNLSNNCKNSNRLNVMYQSFLNKIDPGFKELYDLKEYAKFDPKFLSSQIEKIINIKSGEQVKSGTSNSCIPPYLMNNSIDKNLYHKVSYFAAKGELSKLNSMKDDFYNNDKKKEVVAKSMTELGNYCEKLSNNIFKYSCDEDLSKLRKVTDDGKLNDKIFSIDTSNSNTDNISKNIGEINYLCKSRAVDISESENFDNLLKSFSYTGNSFGLSAKIADSLHYQNVAKDKNFCSSLCSDSSPYSGAGCKFKDLKDLESKYCQSSSEAINEVKCSIVLQQKMRQTTIEINDSMAGLSSEDKKKVYNDFMKDDHKKKLGYLLTNTKDHGSEKSIKSLFFGKKSDAQKKEMPKIVAESNVASSVSQSSEDSKSQMLAKNDRKNAQDQKSDNNQSGQRQVSQNGISNSNGANIQNANQNSNLNSTAGFGGSISFSRSVSSVGNKNNSSESFHGVNSSGLKSMGMKRSEGETRALNRINDLYKELNASENRLSKLADQLDSSMTNSSDNNDRRYSKAKVNRGGAYQQNSYSGDPLPSSQFTPGQARRAASTSATNPSSDSEGGEKNRMPTDIVGRSVTGVSASEERAQARPSGAISAKINSSAISQLFAGELDRSNVQYQGRATASGIKKIRVPEINSKIDLSDLLKNRDEISPGEPFILFEVRNGKSIEVTLIPTYSEFNGKKSFSGYKALSINSNNKELVQKIFASKNLLTE